MTRGRPPYPDVLTPRQFEVLRLVREGLLNEEIARRLGISLDGAKFHVSEIIGKLGVTSRSEAAEWHVDREREASRPSARLRFGGPRLRRRVGCSGRDRCSVARRPRVTMSVQILHLG